MQFVWSWYVRQVRHDSWMVTELLLREETKNYFNRDRDTNKQTKIRFVEAYIVMAALGELHISASGDE